MQGRAPAKTARASVEGKYSACAGNPDGENGEGQRSGGSASTRIKKQAPRFCEGLATIRGANDRIRTGDLRFTRALLYQLSHVGTRLLAKREYELYRKRQLFARGNRKNLRQERPIRRFSMNCEAFAQAAACHAANLEPLHLEVFERLGHLFVALRLHRSDNKAYDQP